MFVSMATGGCAEGHAAQTIFGDQVRAGQAGEVDQALRRCGPRMRRASVTRNGVDEARTAAHTLDDFPTPVDRVEAERDLRYGQMAVVIHQGEDWPSGRPCRNCHAPWPCRVYRWGFRVLLAAKWSTADIAHLEARSRLGEVPWT
jgi:hypothetical protein